MVETFSPAMRLLLATSYRGVLLQTGQPQLLEPDLNLDVDWQEFLQLVKRHGVVNHVLVGLGNVDVPEVVLMHLKDNARHAAIIGLGQLSEVNRLCAAFEDADIPLLPMKGVRLSQRLYGSPSFRFSSDIDLLVSAENLIEAQNLLLSDGYLLQKYAAPFSNRNLERLTNSSGHHLNFYNAEVGIHLELHWRLFYNRYYLPESEMEAFMHRSISQSGSGAGMLSDEDLLIYLCMHGASHSWERLRWLLDILAIAIENEIEWDAWVRRIVSLGVSRPIIQAFALLEINFVITPASPIGELIKNDDKVSELVENTLDVWKIGGFNNYPDSRFGQVSRLVRLIQNRDVLSSDWRYRYDALRRNWCEPTRFKYWELPDELFPLNYVHSLLIRVGNLLFKTWQS